MSNFKAFEKPPKGSFSNSTEQFLTSAVHQDFQHLWVLVSDLILMGNGQNKSPDGRRSQFQSAMGYKAAGIQ